MPGALHGLVRVGVRVRARARDRAGLGVAGYKERAGLGLECYRGSGTWLVQG